MNSVYGRFGMDYQLENHKLMTPEQFNKHVKDKRFQVSAPPKENFGYDCEVSLVSYIDNKKYEKLHTTSGVHINVSIPIASAIAGYARIFGYKNNPDFLLYYSDTDSLMTDRPIRNHLIGKGLGQFKLEKTFEEAIFLAPKVYGGVLAEGGVNSLLKLKV